MLDYSWPGNVRQLRNVLRFALAVCDGGTITTDDLPAELMSADHRAPAATEGPEATRGEAAELEAALRRQRWNVTAAAVELGIARATVYRQMKRFGIVPPNQL